MRFPIVSACIFRVELAIAGPQGIATVGSQTVSHYSWANKRNWVWWLYFSFTGWRSVTTIPHSSNNHYYHLPLVPQSHLTTSFATRGQTPFGQWKLNHPNFSCPFCFWGRFTNYLLITVGSYAVTCLKPKWVYWYPHQGWGPHQNGYCILDWWGDRSYFYYY